jgi:hypothetical protein
LLKLTVPVLHVSNSRRAEAFYCAELGFRCEYAHRPSGRDDPCYRERVLIAYFGTNADLKTRPDGLPLTQMVKDLFQRAAAADRDWLLHSSGDYGGENTCYG